MLALTIALAAQVTLDNRIVRAAPAGEDAAAYVAIGNAGEADRLVGVSCACAERVEIHRVTRDGGNVSMTAEPALAVPGGGVEIRPGSPLHLMLMNLRAPIVAGQPVPLTLRFERAGTVTAGFIATENSAAAWQGVPRSARARRRTAAARLPGRLLLAGDLPQYHAHRHSLLYRDARRPRHSRRPHRRRRAIPLCGRDHLPLGPAGAAHPLRLLRERWRLQLRPCRSRPPTGIDYPQENYVGGNGQTMTLRNVLVRQGEGYSGTSSARQADGSWREMWTMRFARVGPATAPR